MGVKKGQLTVKQKLFKQYYLLTLNATEAARRAGYKGNDSTLAEVGYQNLRKLQIRTAIDAELKHRIPSIEETLARVADHATGDMKEFTTKNESGYPELDLAKAYDADKLRLVKKWNETTVTRYQKDGEPIVTHKVNVELYPADSALDKLMRYHSLYNDTVTVNFADELKELLMSGVVSQQDVEQEVGPDFARELFESIGVMVNTE